MKATFVQALNRLLTNRDELVSNVKLICDTLSDTSRLEEERQKYADEMALVADMVQAAMLENARRVALDQDEYGGRTMLSQSASRKLRKSTTSW